MWIFTKYGFYSAVCARQGISVWQQGTSRIKDKAPEAEHLEGL